MQSSANRWLPWSSQPQFRGLTHQAQHLWFPCRRHALSCACSRSYSLRGTAKVRRTRFARAAGTPGAEAACVLVALSAYEASLLAQASCFSRLIETVAAIYRTHTRQVRRV
jgi:hypothetical protein